MSQVIFQVTHLLITQHNVKPLMGYPLTLFILLIPFRQRSELHYQPLLLPDPANIVVLKAAITAVPACPHAQCPIFCYFCCWLCR